MRDTTPTYVVMIHVPGVRYTPAAWNCRRDGRPTEANLRKYVESFEASTRPGGANAHLGEETVAFARLMRNDGSREVVAYYSGWDVPDTPEAFMVTEII
jgi:hypothetical protein